MFQDKAPFNRLGIITCHTGYCGEDSSDIIAVPAMVSADSMAWEVAVQNAESYGHYSGDDDDEEDGVDYEGAEGNIEPFTLNDIWEYTRDFFRELGGWQVIEWEGKDFNNTDLTIDYAMLSTVIAVGMPEAAGKDALADILFKAVGAKSVTFKDEGKQRLPTRKNYTVYQRVVTVIEVEVKNITQAEYESIIRTHKLPEDAVMKEIKVQSKALYRREESASFT